MAEHYDVIIVGTGAGGGTPGPHPASLRLPPSGFFPSIPR